MNTTVCDIDIERTARGAMHGSKRRGENWAMRLPRAIVKLLIQGWR